MADRKPLVQNAGEVQQLQAGDNLEIPLDGRVEALEENLRQLATLLAAQGLEVPDQLLT